MKMEERDNVEGFMAVERQREREERVARGTQSVWLTVRVHVHSGMREGDGEEEEGER
jgi:hypothetical protein